MSRIKTQFIGEIRKITGPGGYSTDREDLICHSYDGTVGAGLPDVIVYPSSTAEVMALATAAAEYGVPVVARGAGTGLSGGSLPVKGGLVMNFNRMNRVKRIDPGEMLAVVEPGITNWDLKRVAIEAGLFYPPDPSSTRVCTLGGNVAENAGGPYGVKYGVTGDYVIGLEGVLSSGKVFRTGGITRRNVTGYDLTSLLVGSEGTLALITEITLRLLPKPAARRMAIVAFDTVGSAGEAVVAVSGAGAIPAALEIMDSVTIECMEQFRPGHLPAGAAAALLIEVDGDEVAAEAQLQTAVSASEGAGGRLVSAAKDEAEVEALWETRRSISPALSRAAPTKIGEDISVPRTRIPEMLERLRRIGDGNDLVIAVFGHAGDGNLHPNILTDRRDPEKMRRTEAAKAEIFAAALELGGTLSGEHGIGSEKSGFMKDALAPETIGLMRGIKGIFDPGGILNPGKIF